MHRAAVCAGQIIDGIRLCKVRSEVPQKFEFDISVLGCEERQQQLLLQAKRLRYAHMDMADLEAQLKDAADARVRLIATDGVFSMDGDVAPLPEICALARCAAQRGSRAGLE